MDQYFGKFVKLCSTGIERNPTSGKSFVSYYYTKRETYVYGKVYSWKVWDSSYEPTGTVISRLLPRDAIPGTTALLDVNLGVEFTLEEISEKDYPDILSKLEQGYKVEYDFDRKLTEEFKKLVSFNS